MLSHSPVWWTSQRTGFDILEHDKQRGMQRGLLEAEESTNWAQNVELVLDASAHQPVQTRGLQVRPVLPEADAAMHFS
jgi:hypothetical protein